MSVNNAVKVSYPIPRHRADGGGWCAWQSTSMPDGRCPDRCKSAAGAAAVAALDIEWATISECADALTGALDAMRAGRGDPMAGIGAIADRLREIAEEGERA